MTESIAECFIGALQHLEQTRDVEQIASLFADNAEIGNIVAPEQFSGKDGARRFWTQYRHTFDQMQSTFRNIISLDGRSALEWTTEGTSVNGDPIHYDGVSVIEADGANITRFRAYFNPRALGNQLTG